MSASIFSHKAQLKEPLLQPASASGAAISAQEESSSPSLDNSRRSLNRGGSVAAETTSRGHEFEVGVELSSPDSAGAGVGGSLEYYPYRDKDGSVERDEDDDGASSTDSQKELLLSDRFASRMIINHSDDVYRTLPKPFNPG